MTVVCHLHKGDVAWLLLSFPGTELFDYVQLYSEDGLEMAIYWRQLEGLGTFIVQMSWETKLIKLIQNLHL